MRTLYDDLPINGTSLAYRDISLMWTKVDLRLLVSFEIYGKIKKVPAIMNRDDSNLDCLYTCI